MNWQPIETAPTDGTEILGANLYADEPYVCMTVMFEGDWHTAVFGGSMYCPARWNPSHWMSMPDAIRSVTSTTSDAEIKRLTTALKEIRDLEPAPFNAYPADWKEQIAACAKCQDYKDHPIMRGICDTHRQPMNDRESHDAHQVRSLGYRAKGIARDALSLPAMFSNSITLGSGVIVR